MLTSSASLAVGVAFLMLGGLNVWLVLEAWSRVKAANASSRMLRLHRVGGYLFIALFCVMTYFMLGRLRGAADVSPTVTIHLTLMPIGLTIFVLSFVLIASTAGRYLARASRIERVSIDPAHVPAVAIDMNQASDLLQRRCSKCHNLDRVVGARKDAQGWVATVDRMRAMPGAGISDAEARMIVSFLAAQAQPKGSESAVKMEVARALVDQRCGRCHRLDRVYKAVETPAQWREIVTRMVGYAADSTGALQPGEDTRIIDYLSAMQTPEAAAQRKAQADAAASAGRSLIARNQRTSTIAAPPAEEPQYDGKTMGFISLVCFAAIALVVRRPVARPSAPAPAVTRPPVISPFILELVQIVEQTPDSKTLRFAVNGDRKPDALPGQFLTFSFLFDGKKETRCYTICSSPARSGYVEITPKRVKGGCVSVFLNNRAWIGMTVEATGPSGRFYHTPAVEKRIVLLAAGSGITPMMAILRYIDDLCLDTETTLLYCARTRHDIMFCRELEELQARLKNFRYRVLLSNPDTEWTGDRGHIHREFVSQAVPETAGRVFFLCGPPPFMDGAKSILRELGVEAEQIRQEIFGGAGAPPKPAAAGAAETAFTIEFVGSGKTAKVREGQTLLEGAAEAGVEIPSACRQGQCGTCKTRLLAGDVEMAAEQGLDGESRAQGFVLPCVGRANGNVRLDA